MYKTMRLNPLWIWDREDTINWIGKGFRGMTATDAEEDVEEIDDNSDQ